MHRSKKYIQNEDAIVLLENEESVILPTETVYGLAADAYSHSAVKKIFELKQRPYKKAMIVHYASIPKMECDVIFTSYARKLAEHFWPGPLTLILPKKISSRISSLATANSANVAVRIPAHSISFEIIRHFGNPVVMPSANLYQSVSPTNAHDAAMCLPDIPVVDGGYSKQGIESTIVDCTGVFPVILRYGSILPEHITRLLNQNIKCLSGQKKGVSGSSARHYGISKPLRLNATTVLPGEALLAFGDTNINADISFNLSKKGDLREAARKLFYLLNKLDNVKCKAVAVMSIPNEGIGLALNEKLIKASILEYNDDDRRS